MENCRCSTNNLVTFKSQLSSYVTVLSCIIYRWRTDSRPSLQRKCREILNMKKAGYYSM